jgi:hypothetical protein
MERRTNKKTVCNHEHDHRGNIEMAKIHNNLVSTARVYSENKYAEFTTFFRIPFKEMPLEEVYGKDPSHRWKDLIGSWSATCVLALNMRIDSCVAMLSRNRDRVLISNEHQVVFKKSNGQIHAFNYCSYDAMLEAIHQLEMGDWEAFRRNELGVRQLLKALYWLPEEERQDHGGFGFGQLISCLEEFTLKF